MISYLVFLGICTETSRCRNLIGTVVWEMTVAQRAGVDPASRELNVMRNIFDLEYCINNGVLSIRPSRLGHLASLCLTTKRGVERAWTFGDVRTYKDADGDERIFHNLRGALNGTVQEGRDFMEMCKDLGLIVQAGSFGVPFSNGPDVYGHLSNGHGVTVKMDDYSPEELKMMRWDLPTRTQIAALAR